MATASIAARAGVLALSTGASASSTDQIAEVRNMRLRVTQDQHDATSNDSAGWAESVHGIRAWTGTFESLYVPTTAMTSRSFVDAILNDYALAIRFFPSTAASATHNYSGTVNVTDFELGGDVNGLWLNNVSMQGNGALSYSSST